MARIHWPQLPPAVRAAVAEHTGTVRTATTANGGANSAIAARVHAENGRYFVKGVRADHPQAVTQHREAAINPYLPPGCPRLLWRIHAADWDLLGFELLAGRTADYAPGSPDLALVAAAVAELPDTPYPADLPLKRAEQRWTAYINPDFRPTLAGDALLHTDLAPHNVIIDADPTDPDAHLIDWAWPTRGAAWIDPAVWVIRLIDDGHTPPAAENWAAQLPAWHTAPPAAVDAFAAANHIMWREIADQDPATPWKQRMAHSAHRWAAHRTAT